MKTDLKIGEKLAKLNFVNLYTNYLSPGASLTKDE